MSRFVVREEIIEEYLSDSEDTDAELAREANNLDLRYRVRVRCRYSLWTAKVLI